MNSSLCINCNNPIEAVRFNLIKTNYCSSCAKIYQIPRKKGILVFDKNLIPEIQIVSQNLFDTHQQFYNNIDDPETEKYFQEV
jgi:hypothetical protein